MYRTGDRGRWHRSGYIEFLGREDQQVKLQGFRVELGDVEFALKSSELVAEACVVCRDETGNGTPHLEAYITLTEAGKTCIQAEQRIRELVTAALPTYMAPSAIISLNVSHFHATANWIAPCYRQAPNGVRPAMLHPRRPRNSCCYESCWRIR